MTTHLTHEGDSLAPEDEEEPELVLIDDDEFEAAHRDDEAFDEVDDENVIADGDEPDFSFEDELDEAIALDVSDEMDPGVEDADERMAPLFHSQHEVPDPSSELAPSGDDNALDGGTGDGLAAAAAAAALAAPVLSKQEAKAEEKRHREALKRRKEIDKAASQDEKERQRDEKAAAVAAERAALAAQKDAAEADKREAAEAKKQAAEDKKQAAEDEKQAAAEAKKQAAEDKKQAAEDEKRAAAEAKVRQAEEKAEQKAEAKRSRTEAKESRAEAKRKAKRHQEPIVPTGLTHFVVDEQQPEWAPTQPVKAAPLKHGTTRTPIVAMLVVLLVVAGVAVYAITRSTPKAAPPRAAAHVNALPAALASLISANTADVAYAQHVGGALPADVNGGGSIDLATQGSNLSVTDSTAGKRFPEQIIYDGSQAFYDLGAIVHYVTPAYNWVSTDMTAGAPGSPGIGVGGVLSDPSALVSVVQASAPSAKEIGKVQLDGVTVTEYSIALDQAAVTHLLATPGLPAYVQTATYTQLDEQVYVDGSGSVSRIVAGGTYAESGRTITASTTLDLSHFGNPVSVAPPPPSQVVSEQQFEASADRIAQAPTS